MECAADGTPPPVELVTAWQCQRWGTLPDEGALYQQDYQTMYRMNTYQSIFNTVQRAKRLTGKNIHQLTESERLILRRLMDQGILFRA